VSVEAARLLVEAWKTKQVRHSMYNDVNQQFNRLTYSTTTAVYPEPREHSMTIKMDTSKSPKLGLTVSYGVRHDAGEL